MHSMKITLAIGFALIVAGIVFALSRAPLSVARVNTRAEQPLGTIDKRTELCQEGERLPAGTTAIRLRAFSYTGQRVTVRALEGPTVIAHGERGPGWSGAVVTVPVAPLTSARAVKLCFTLFIEDGEADNLAGEPDETAQTTLSTGGRLQGRVGIEYLRPGRSSWLSLAPDVAKRMGFGNAGSGLWNVVLAIALMAGVGLLTARMILRAQR
jgi:hypothetical protein